MLSEIQRTWQNPRTSWGHKCIWEKNNVQSGHRESLLSCVHEMLLTPGFPVSKWLRERKMIFYYFIIINNNNIKSYQFVGRWHVTHHMWRSKEKLLRCLSSITFMWESGIKLFDQICMASPFAASSDSEEWYICLIPLCSLVTECVFYR